MSPLLLLVDAVSRLLVAVGAEVAALQREQQALHQGSRPAVPCSTDHAPLPPFRTPAALPAGKPRRLSLKFLKEERVRLERWRDGCRQQYQSGAAATADPKVADHLPRPLGVGQPVVARHPSTRQLHDGNVLTVAHNCYRWAKALLLLHGSSVPLAVLLEVECWVGDWAWRLCHAMFAASSGRW